MAVTHGHQPDCTRRSDGVRHTRSGRARIAVRIKKCARGDIASHVPRPMAVCNDYLRVGVVPAESHLDFENKARDSFFCKSRINERYRAVARTANDVKHLSVTMHGSCSIPRGTFKKCASWATRLRGPGLCAAPAMAEWWAPMITNPTALAAPTGPGTRDPVAHESRPGLKSARVL